MSKISQSSVSSVAPFQNGVQVYERARLLGTCYPSLAWPSSEGAEREGNPPENRLILSLCPSPSPDPPVPRVISFFTTERQASRLRHPAQKVDLLCSP